MCLETDRQPFGTAGETAELVEGALVRRDFRREAVIFVADVVVEGTWGLFVHQLGKGIQGHRLADLRLAGGVVHQHVSLRTGLFFGQVFAFHEVAEGLEQSAGLARSIHALGAADEVAEVVQSFPAALALDEGDVLLGVLVIAPLGDVDPRGHVQLAEVQVTRGSDLERLSHRHALAVMQDGDREVVGHALLVMAEQDVATGREVGLFHQELEVLDSLNAEGGEVFAVIQVLGQPTAERVCAGLALEQAPGLVRLGVVALIEIGHQIFDGLGLDQLDVAGMQRRGIAVRLLVDVVDLDVSYRHVASWVKFPSQARMGLGICNPRIRPSYWEVSIRAKWIRRHCWTPEKEQLRMLRKLLNRLATGSSRTKYIEPEIRLASDAEIQSFAVLIQGEVGNGHFTGPRSDQELTDYTWQVQASNQAHLQGENVQATTYSILAAGEPIGLCVLMATDSAAVVDLNVLVIDPKWRGRGFGRFVIAGFQEQLELSGRRLQVRCMPASEGMISLVLQLGFCEKLSAPGSLRTFLSPVGA